MRIIAFGADLPCRYIRAYNPLISHTHLCKLAEIRELRSCQDLISRDITIHTIQTDILWKKSLEVCHEVYQGLIIIWSEPSISPYIFELRVRSDDHRIDLHLIWSEVGA